MQNIFYLLFQFMLSFDNNFRTKKSTRITTVTILLFSAVQQTKKEKQKKNE